MSIDPRKRQVYRNNRDILPHYEQDAEEVLDYLTRYVIFATEQDKISEAFVDRLFQQTQKMAEEARFYNESTHFLMGKEEYDDWQKRGCNLDLIMEQQKQRAFCHATRVDAKKNTLINCAYPEVLTSPEHRKKCEELGCSQKDQQDLARHTANEEYKCQGKKFENEVMRIPNLDSAYHYKMGEGLKSITRVPADASTTEKAIAIDRFASMTHHGGNVFDLIGDRSQALTLEATALLARDVLDAVLGVDWEA